MEVEQEEKVIIAFINPGSGGGQGVKVLNDLKSILEDPTEEYNPKKVYDLKEDKGPRKGLEEWKHINDLVVIAGGGDGTVGWVLSVIDTMEFPEGHPPQVVPLALGTANDMSRILKWGKGYTGDPLGDFVYRVRKSSKPILLDRWEVKLCKLNEEELRFYLEQIAKSDEEHKKEGENTAIRKSLPTMSQPKKKTKAEKQKFSSDTFPKTERSEKSSSSEHKPKEPKKNKSTLSSTSSDIPPPRPKSPIPTLESPPKRSSLHLLEEQIQQASPTIEIIDVNNNSPQQTEEFVLVETTTSEPMTPTTASPEEQHEQFAKLEPKEQTKTWIANNYFSVGIDSKILLDFDTLRNTHPSYFPHRMINFGWYGLIGLKSMMENYQSLRHYCILKIKEPGGNELRTIRLPKKVKALVFLNVPSYSGGTNPWKQARNIEDVKETSSQSINDGVIEIFAMEGAAHIGRTLASVSRGGIRVAQAESIELITLQEVAGQVDGEPYFLLPCKITIDIKHKSTMLFNTSNDGTGNKYNLLQGGSK